MTDPHGRIRLTVVCPPQTGDMSLLQEACQCDLDLCHVQAKQIYWTHEDKGGGAAEVLIFFMRLYINL